MNLHATDLTILLAYMLATLGFGVWTGRHNKNATDFALGGRDLPWWAILLSIVATETSTVTFLSIPGLAFREDLRFLQLAFGFLLGRLFVVWLLLPGYFRGQIFTAYEVLEQRFGGMTRPVASLLFLVTRTLGDGLRLFLSALVLWKITGITPAQAILAIGSVTILYTLIGGMRAVVWMDCVQFVVYMGGAALAGYVLLDGVSGGLPQVMTVASEAGKLRWLDTGFDLRDAHCLWAGLFGGAFVSLGSHGADQLMVQRYLCARSQRAAGWALALSGPVVVVQFAIFLLLGVGLYAFYGQRPDVQFGASDTVFATFIIHELPTGVVGVVLGAVFAAAMSTLSSSLHSSATALVKDLRLQPFGGVWSLRFGTLLCGGLQVAVALWATGLAEDSPVVSRVLAIQSFTIGVLLGVFFLSMVSRRASRNAAVFAMVAGLGVMSWVAFGSDLAWPWYAVVGSLSTLAFGLLATIRQPMP